MFSPFFRLWDIECGACLRVLEGHEELVRCIRFDSKRIVSGAYDGKIKVWDLVAALDPRAQASTLCLKTLVVRCIALLSKNLITFRFRNILVVYLGCNSTNFKLLAVLTTTQY